MGTFKNIIKKYFYGFLCFLIFFQQTYPAYAQISVDPSAPASNQAGITTAPNGVDVINIVTPTASGLSHNKFNEYNVPASGVILNNSAVVGTSSLGGTMIGNSNISAGNEASVILNEVTSANPSLLEGATEVFGSSADVIVANPNGITCRGCGFINIPNATLTTGNPTVAGGALTNLSINDGTITIEGAGLNNTGGKAKILSRAIQINSDIQAGEIEIISGRNDYNPSTGVTTAKADDGSPKPAFAIDSSAVGGMYAGKITLKGTESGVGFRLSGDMASSVDDIVLTSTGRIEVKNVASQRHIQATTAGGHDIDLDGAITSEDNTTLTSSNDINITSSSTIESKGASTSLQADNFITNNGGAVIGYQDMTISAAQLINDTGAIIAGNDLTIEGAIAATRMNILDNLGGSIESINGDISILANTVNNISDVQTESSTTTFGYRYALGPKPAYINQRGQDLTPEAWAYFFSGSHTMAINPFMIEDVLADKGRTLSEFYVSPNYYLFEVADWQSLSPQNTSGWRAILNAGLAEQDKSWSLLATAGDRSSDIYYVRLITDRLQDGTTPQIAGISAQDGNITIDATNINNDKGYISAANDITLTGTNLNLTAATFRERVVQSVTYPNGTQIRETGWGTWLQFAQSITRYNNVLGNVPATIAAGGTVTGNLSGSVSSVSAPVSEFSDFDFGGVSSGNIRTTLETGNSTGSLFVNSGSVQPATNNNFKFETRFSFTDLGTFYGSDYFLTGVLGAGYDPDAITRRLGDAYIDSKIINEQVLAQSGRKYLDQSYGSDTDQVKDLLDRGIAAQTNLGLTPFISLTAEQQAALTEDIVWYEEREVDGEILLVPQLYLAQATLDETGTKLRGATITGNSVDIDAQDIRLDMTRIAANDDINLNATDDITVISGVLDGDNINLDAGQNVTIATGKTITGNGSTEIGTVKDLTAQVEAQNNLTINAGETTSIIGSAVKAGGDLVARAKNIVVSALDLNSYSKRSGDKYKNVENQKTSQDESTLSAGGSLTLDATENVVVHGSELDAKDDINLTATLGDVRVTAARETQSGRFEKESSKGSNELIEHKSSKLSTQTGDVNITSGLGDVTLRASEIDSGNDINLTANAGKVELLVEKDRDFHHHTVTKSNAVWQKFKDSGHEHETVRHTILTGEGNLNITAANGVTVEYRSTGNLDQDIAQLAQAPGLAWMADLQNDPNVDWTAVKEVHREWHEEQEGLSGPAAVAIAIAITIATNGAGASFIGAAEGTTLAAASNAGFSALASQAAISLINNKGDIGAVFKDLASSETVRSVAAAALTAGLLKEAGVADLANNSSDFFAADAVVSNLQDQLIAAGIRSGVDTVVTGADLSESLKSNLRFAGAAVLGAQLSQEIGIEFTKGELDPSTGINRGVQLMAHAALGCAAGAVGTGNCSTGSASQLAGEISALLYSGGMTQAEIAQQTQEWQNRGIDIARLSGALAAAIAGGNEDDVSLGSNAGGTAAANNALCGGLCVTAAISAIIAASGYYGTQSVAQLITGLDVLGNDPIGQAIADGAQGAVEISYATFPEQTQAALNVLEAAGETAGIVVTYVDDKTGNTVSGAWNDISDANKNRIIGGIGLVSAIIPATGVSKISQIKTTGAINSAALTGKFKAVLPDNDGQIKHIFRDAEGHLPDTLENRKLLLDVSSSRANYIGENEFGVKWFSKTLDDGTQVWGTSRNGVIQNGGLNTEYIDLVERYNLKK